MMSFLTSAVVCLCWATLVAVATVWASYAAAYDRPREAAFTSFVRVVLRYVAYGATINEALIQHSRAGSVGMWLLLIAFVTHHIEVTTVREPCGRVSISATLKRLGTPPSH